jgi:hypothetical protein
LADAILQALGIRGINSAKQVISMLGDGGSSLLLGDLVTLDRLERPNEVVIFIN